MRARVRQAKRKASMLHGATAAYVSIVDRGANETPFTMIKTAEGAGAMGIKKRNTESKSHKKLGTKKKSETPVVETKTVIAKMVFDQDHFGTEQDVRDWIEKAEWEAESIVITDDESGSFVARAEGTSDESFSRIAKVEAETEGVEAYVGEMIVKSEDDEDDEDEDDEDDGEEDADDDDAAETEAKADDKAKAQETSKKADDKPATPAKVSKRAEFIAKAKSTVAKFDSWDAFYSKKSTLVESLQAGMKWDATPPGFYEVQNAFNGVVQGILNDEELEGAAKAEALSKAAGDYADLIAGLDTFFDGYIEAKSETIAKSFTTDEARDKLAKWAEGYAQFVGGGEEPTVETKSTIKKTVDVPAGISEDKIADLIAKAVAPVMEQVEGVATTVQKMSARRPSKKGADLTDSGTGDKEPEKIEKAGDWMATKQRKGLLGG